MGAMLGGGGQDNRFLRQWAAVILGMAILSLAALLAIIPRYHLQQQALSLAREQAMRGNMRVLQVSLEQYLAEDGRGYPTALSRTDPRQEDPMLDFLSSSLQRLSNPIDKDAPAVAVSRKDPPFWKSFRPGQVIYVPLQVRDGYAAGYAIYGLGSKGPLAAVLQQRPEPVRQPPSGQEQGPND